MSMFSPKESAPKKIKTKTKKKRINKRSIENTKKNRADLIVFTS